MDNHRQSIIDLENKIDALQLQHGPFSEALIEPVMELAKLHLAEQDLESATDQLYRAQNIAHRNEGVYTPRQFEAVSLLTQIALMEADYQAADIQKKFAFFVQSHHLALDDPDILFAYADMADWYMNTGQTRRARQMLKQGMEKATSLDLSPLPLAVMLSRARRLEGVCCVLKQLLTLVEQMPGTDPDSLASAYLELADTYILAGKEEVAAEYFLKANAISPMSVSVEPRPISVRKTVSDPKAEHTRVYSVERQLLDRLRLDRRTREDILEDLALEPQWFIIDGSAAHQGFTVPDSNSTATQNREYEELVGFPILFSEDQLNNIVPLRYKDGKDELRIELTFTVTDEGDLDDIEVTSSTAPVKLNRLVVSALKKTYYRPALEDGVPVTTRNVKLVQTFSSRYKDV